MSSILKVDTIQTAAGGTPTAADLGLNVSGNMLAVYTVKGVNTELSVSSDTPTATGVYIDVTPSSTSSKFWVMATAPIHINTDNNQNGSAISVRADNADISIHGGIRWNEYANIPGWTTSTITLQGIHEPSTTSSVRYEMYLSHMSGTSGSTGYFAPNHFDNPTASRPTLTVIEIAG